MSVEEIVNDQTSKFFSKFVPCMLLKVWKLKTALHFWDTLGNLKWGFKIIILLNFKHVLWSTYSFYYFFLIYDELFFKGIFSFQDF